ncbi:tRNA modification GTPase MnmE [Thermaurantimonas aggregans]|uniref:tRNA modification GTPase MnmE n=1 Tax=Thermaurantimonas aggregans TaxID=2173829 RepID=A0A401XJF1_9FLAO|nr:tRNA uridine-5-carboxymethylaminomethyl(34) synthesis GTPase MnmE [Thermaurantimonas aggregans]MCX8148678.1 tRNA uridine-5-carboxymethylaminomethyl(34) synthesis GTPase MnmE [Thermaurantimonas aggregans]GCD77142.1 tRNA modification GTPase MnmE [Thermaurantimonas aggregans]
MVTADTIAAIATPYGQGAIGVIRLSGKDAFSIVKQYFRPAKGSFEPKLVRGYTLRYGEWWYQRELIDEVLISFFVQPHSYTGEDVVEISCHGSPYILNRTLESCLDAGARLAEPGEFTLRAFRNGKLDLGQAEAVADLIASESKAAHQIAMHQLKGHFSRELDEMRTQLIEFTGLLELELDFAEEDVEFADRSRFFELLDRIKHRLRTLIESFSLGNAIKNGVPVAILGAPNAGKSTLLNALLGEEKAIVSHIAGTTRDVIEDVITIDGIQFRFIDTAGLRKTSDEIEEIGIRKALERASKARIILYVFDVHASSQSEVHATYELIKEHAPDATILKVGNKADLVQDVEFLDGDILYISAKEKVGIDVLKKALVKEILREKRIDNQVIITNVRHLDALKKSITALEEAERGLRSGLSGELVAIDLRQALYHMGSITGQVVADDILGYIFANFCIGK